jgi:hypothetical protein
VQRSMAISSVAWWLSSNTRRAKNTLLLLELASGAGLASHRVEGWRFPNVSPRPIRLSISVTMAMPAGVCLAGHVGAAATVSRRLSAPNVRPSRSSRPLMAGAPCQTDPPPKAAWLACAVSRTKHDSGLGPKQMVPSQTAAATAAEPSSLEGAPC